MKRRNPVGSNVPRPQVRPLPPVEELLIELREAGVDGAPESGPEQELAAILLLAADLAQLRKRLDFSGFSWDDPGFAAVDAKARVDVRYAKGARERLADALRASLPRLRGDVALLALDFRGSGVKEFEAAHLLFGEVTLFEHRKRPSESADPRIHAALEAGWGKALKEHNLVPGRGLVVLDEHHGLLLREPDLGRLPGLFVLFDDARWHLWWNPIAGLPGELQYWLSWGPGTAPASEWREVVRYDGDDA